MDHEGVATKPYTPSGGLKDIQCPKCGHSAMEDGADFESDNRMNDDLGIVEYYRCSLCGQDYKAYLRYVAVVAE